jgi:hypothetical protein
MPEFRNLPGSIVVKEDNNLTVLESIPGDVTLILGTSLDGPLEALYPVYDSADADKVFDPNGSRSGTLLRGMYEALEGGARNVVLFRIGATPAFINSLNGWTIIKKDTSDKDYAVYYSYTALTDSHILKIKDTVSGLEVYNSLTGYDTGALTVLFDTKTSTTDIAVGTPTAYVAFADINVAIGVSQPISFVLGGTTATLDAATIIKAGMTVKISGAVTAEDNGEYRVSYFYDNGIAKTIHLSHKLIGTDWLKFTGFAGISGVSANVTPNSSFYPEVTGINASYNELYEALAKAYWTLESAKVDMVVPMGVFHNTPNLVNNIGIDQIPAESNFLGKAYQFEHLGDLFTIWQTDMDAVGDIMPSPYSLGVDGLSASKLVSGQYSIAEILSLTVAPIADITFTEVNFTHQLATFLYGLSVNDNESLGTISMRGPSNYTRQGVSSWLGVEPTYSVDGSMITSGTGLLGNKWMVGSTGKSEGFFATSNGLAGGTVTIDPNTRQKTDIGQYVSVVATPLLSRGSYSISEAGYIAPSSAIYAGFVMSLPSNQSPTNKAVTTVVSLPFLLKKQYLDQLVGSKYVVFAQNSFGQTKVVDAPTASLKTSDYNRLMTVRCVMSAVEVVRNISEPFIGNMYTGEIRNALQEQVNSALVELQKIGFLQKGKAEVRATRAQEIKGEGAMRLSLTTPGEFRRLTILVSLAK